MLKSLRLIILFSTFFISCFAKAGTGVGEWRTHFSYNNVNQVVVTDSKVFAVASGKLFSYDNNNKRLETYSSLTGLNGFEVLFIDWSEQEKVLMIVYSDGNIDFLNDQGILNLPDFKNKSLTADKVVNNLRIDGRFAYMLTGVGMIVVDLRNKEIKATYSPEFSGEKLPVYDVAVLNDTAWVVTSKGFYTGSLKDNLLDPSEWTLKQTDIKSNISSIIESGGNLYFLSDNKYVYKKINNGINKLIYSGENVKKLKIAGKYLAVCGKNEVSLFDETDKEVGNKISPAYDLSYDEISDSFFVASGNKGISVAVLNGNIFKVSDLNIKPNGPNEVFAWNSFFKDGVYFASCGGRWGDRYYLPGEILTYENENWCGLVKKDSVEKATGVPFMDILNIAVDPEDKGHFFLTSWGEGLYEFRDSVFYKLHNQYNSPLITTIEGARFCRVDGAVFDDSGNLWVLNSTYGVSSVLSEKTLWALTPQGEWKGMSYNTMPGAPTWNSILFTSKNQIWINSLRYIYGVFVINQNGTPFDTSDDDTRWFSSFTDQDGITLSPYTVNCIVEDLNGTIWIGTRLGPLVAGNPSNVFSSDFTFSRVKVPRNDGTNAADYLLNDIRVNCIAVDGANRKWMGTEGNGIYLLSPDGTETIHQFTTQNSPLPSDYIYSVSVNPENGEVFIGTDAGLVSYRGEATVGEVSFDDIHVFPNPVRPGYAGKITVTGLMENSQVKITDLNGNILVSGTSLGGQFVWDGYNVRGNRVSSGVYIVLCASEDGTMYKTCKFMVVN